MTFFGRYPRTAGWVVSLAIFIAIIVNTTFVADLSAFMPRAPTERQQMLMDQFRDGIVAKLILMGIEGGDAAERARLSQHLAAALRKNPAFIGVQNGEEALQELDRRYFFDNRYLLSPGVTPSRFTSDGLHQAISQSLEALSGSAGLFLKGLLSRDPTGETKALLDQFAGENQPNSVEGVWASRDGERALLLAQTSAAGSDTDAQSITLLTINSIFEGIPQRHAGTRLVMTGTSVFSVSSRATIESEISRLAVASLVLVIGLLLVVYRSPVLIFLSLLPVVTGALAGIATVSLCFGHIHGLTLGFGTTLIGEAVDYAIYLFIQQPGDDTRNNFWRTIRVGLLTSIAGFTVLLASGFPSLAQLGAYSISGLIAAVLVTRYVLPEITPINTSLRDLSVLGVIVDKVIVQSCRLRWLVIALLLGAAISIALHSGSLWNKRLSALSPISKAEQQLDDELRKDMGAPEMRYIVVMNASSDDQALQKAEKAGTVLTSLVGAGVIGGFNSPAIALPSQNAQRLRQAALPDTETLRSSLDHALVGLPIKAERIQLFLTDIDSARTHKLLTRSDLDGTSTALLVDSLLIKREADWLVLMPLRSINNGTTESLIDIDKVEAALRNVTDINATVIDLLDETTNLFDNHLREALSLSYFGCLSIIGLLLVSLRSLSRTLRVAVPLACSVLCVTAALLAAGVQLTILHLVGLQLVIAVGSNYALFFDSGSLGGDIRSRQKTQVSLLISNLTTVGSFGLLGLSNVPVLSAIGVTVGPGAFLALIFSAIMARRDESNTPA